MRRADSHKLIHNSACRVIGWQDVRELGHLRVLGLLASAFDHSESALLAEPSLAYRSKRPPDIVLIDPEVGVHVVEVKGVTLDQIESVQAGGVLRIRYRGPTPRAANVLKQARDAMFDIKDATARAFGGDLRLRFEAWVAFPKIARADWHQKFGQLAFCCDEFLFAEELEPDLLTPRFGATTRNGSRPVRVLPLEQLNHVWTAFGDTSVIYWKPDERSDRRGTGDGTLGEVFDEAALSHKRLTDEQQKLIEANWDEGPRLVRGVAGSGKTIVLAANCARRLVRSLRDTQELFASRRPRVLAVCYNRTLTPFLRGKIEAAFQQRTGREIPADCLDVFAMNRLEYHLSGENGLWRYQHVFDKTKEGERQQRYLDQLRATRERDPALFESKTYDAIYVDEGQDLTETEYTILKELCRQEGGREPNLYVFYDDAQNLYGRTRPNWASLGLNMRGARASVMTQCHRNTKVIVDTAANVLYASAGPPAATAPTREFFDLGGLQEKGLVTTQDGLLRVAFAQRAGHRPLFTLAPSAQAEIDLLLARLAILLTKERVRPEDILVLSSRGARVAEFADAAERAKLPGVTGINRPMLRAEKDTTLCRRGHLTFSTVASAKGYDAFVTLLVSANEFRTEVRGRASFYVGCTRAIECLELFAYAPTGLAEEAEAVLSRLGAPPVRPAPAPRARDAGV